MKLHDPGLRDPSAKNVHYPESDGQPMAETDTHRNNMVELIATIDERFRDDPMVYVSGNLFIYWREGNNRGTAPDVFVVFGAPRGERRTFKVWEEEAVPDVVIELTSKKTSREDREEKYKLYESNHVQEYFIYDPFAPRRRGARRGTALIGFRLVDGSYRPLEPIDNEDALAYRSDSLELELLVTVDRLRLREPGGAILPTPQEAAESERSRAESERSRAEAAEKEIARLREELERLRGGASKGE